MQSPPIGGLNFSRAQRLRIATARNETMDHSRVRAFNAHGSGSNPGYRSVGGGVEAIQELLAELPANFPAAVFVVLHIGAHKSILPQLLNRRGPLPAGHPNDCDRIVAGHVYIAPPDHNMILEDGIIRLTKGPRENWVRPSIDPLFCSAARFYGLRVVAASYASYAIPWRTSGAVPSDGRQHPR